MTITKQVEALASLMSKFETISVENGKRLLALLDKAPQEALQMLVDRKVKFMWMPAKRRLADKFGVK